MRIFSISARIFLGSLTKPESTANFLSSMLLKAFLNIAALEFVRESRECEKFEFSSNLMTQPTNALSWILPSQLSSDCSVFPQSSPRIIPRLNLIKEFRREAIQSNEKWNVNIYPLNWIKRCWCCESNKKWRNLINLLVWLFTFCARRLIKFLLSQTGFCLSTLESDFQ